MDRTIIQCIIFFIIIIIFFFFSIWYIDSLS